MTMDEILGLIARQAGHVRPLPWRPDVPVRDTIGPPAPADVLDAARQTFEVPPDLLRLWTTAGTVRLFEDVRYGQWGLVLLAPEQALRETASMTGQWPEDVLAGDLALGTFLGDRQRLVVRCDKQAADFGRVLVGLPIYSRKDWPTAGDDLSDFLTRFIAAGGRHYWPH